MNQGLLKTCAGQSLSSIILWMSCEQPLFIDLKRSTRASIYCLSLSQPFSCRESATDMIICSLSDSYCSVYSMLFQYLLTASESEHSHIFRGFFSLSIWGAVNSFFNEFLKVLNILFTLLSAFQRFMNTHIVWCNTWWIFQSLIQVIVCAVDLICFVLTVVYKCS
jgi:hypothetical protein